MALVDGQRGEDGEDLPVEHLGQVVPVLVVQGVPVGQGDPGRREGGADCRRRKIWLCRSTSSVARAVMAASC